VHDTVSMPNHLTSTLPTSITNPLLTTVPASFHGSIEDVLLTALVVAVAHWRWSRGQILSNALVVDLDRDGREEIFMGVDLSHTVGWFTNLAPVRLDPGLLDMQEAWAGGKSLGRTCKVIKEQLRAIPKGGIGYGLLRYLNAETSPIFAALSTPEIGFHYLGRFVSAEKDDWALASEVRPLVRGSNPQMPLAHCVEVNAITLDCSDGPQLSVTWLWAPALISAAAVREIAEGWLHVLTVLVRNDVQKSLEGLTPSDVALVSLTQAEIDRLEQ
jgi:non-ribosomal peptide synthase protein (TIGR01720 family)